MPYLQTHMTHQQRPIHWEVSDGLKPRHEPFAEEFGLCWGGRSASCFELPLLSVMTRKTEKKSPTWWQTGCSYVQYVMQLCTHFYKEIGEWRGGSWWVHMCDVLPVLLFASRQFLLVLLCSLCCPHIVGEPTTGFFFLGLCTIWVVDQQILDSSCRCSTEVSVPFCWCCWCLLDSSVTVWCGSTTMVFCLPKPRFVDYLLVRCTFLISQPTIWSKPTQFWIGWIYIFIYVFPVQ